MRDMLRSIDRLLRGHFTRATALEAGRIELPIKPLLIAGVGLGVIYGAFMAWFNGGAAQFGASAIKVPLLFLATLVVTFPSLYVFSALANSRLTLESTLKLLLAAITVNLALLASFGPVTGFFTASTESYPFMVMLNVVFFALSGFAGLSFLRRALDAVFSLTPSSPPQPPNPDAVDAEQDADADAAVPPPPAAAPKRTQQEMVEAREQLATSKRIFNTWTVIYCVVGAQMSWILRPFVGSPTQPFEFFRERDSHFFEAVAATLKRLFE